MDKALRQRYQELYKHLSKIHVCNVSFDHLIGEFGISTTSGLSLLENELSFTRPASPLRVQLRDISGIASNGLSHYLAFLWAEGSARFGMNNYKNVFVITRGNLRDDPDKSKPPKVKKAILETYKELTGEEGVFEVDDTFWKETLFIISNYNGKEFRWLNGLANVLVIGEKYPDGVTLAPNISDFTCYDIGLVSPKMGIVGKDGKLLKSITGNQLLAIEKRIRETFLMRISESKGVVDYTNPTLVKEADGKLSVLGRERMVRHKFPLVRNLTEIIIRVLEKKDLSGYNAQAFSQTSDWYTAAVSAEVPDDINDLKELYSYNIGGNLFIRKSGNNYFSNLGPIDVILPIIIEEIKNKIDGFVDEVIRDSTDETTLAIQLISRVASHLETKFVLNTEAEHDTSSLSIARIESPLASVSGIDPSYEKLAEQIVAVDQATLGQKVREVLSNKATTAQPFIYTLVACLFIAEPARCPQTLLPTIMMLDLCDEGLLNWSDVIFQTTLLEGVSGHLKKDLNKALLSFSGSLPMTQKSSFLQAKTIKNYTYGADRQLMTWVEYKSSAIMMKWFDLSNQRIRTRTSEEAVYWEATIFERFNDRLANFARIGTPEFGMQISTDFTHLDRRMGEVRTLDESQKRYIVFGVSKGYPIPIYDRSTGKRIFGLEDARESKVFSDTSTLDYGSSDEETVDEATHSPQNDETSKPRIFRDKIRKDGSATHKSPHDFHKCTVHKPLSQRNPITEKVTGVLHSHTDRVVAYRDARSQYIVNKENSSKSSFSR